MLYNYRSATVKVKDFFKSFELRSLSMNEKEKHYEILKNKIDKICRCINKEKEGIMEKDVVIVEGITDF